MVAVLFPVFVTGARNPQCGVVMVMLSVTEPKSETSSEPVVVTNLTVGDFHGLTKPHIHLSFLHNDFSSSSLSQSEPVGNGPQGFFVDVAQYGKSPGRFGLR